MLHKLSSRWLRTCVPLLACVALALVSAAPASASAVSTKFPIDLFVNVPCANGGSGEVVELTGTLNDVFSLTFDNAGGVHVKGHDNPQGVSGVGLTSGVKFQGTGMSDFEYSQKVGYEETDVNNFRIIGQGTGNNYVVHENLHVTVDANGVVTVLHDHFSITCK